MPPKQTVTGNFQQPGDQNEVVCPLQNNDGSTCRKRCFGEKRFRSMQEHIRRAHPDYYISKLPATEESFMLMVSQDPPPPRPPQPPSAQQQPIPPPMPHAQQLQQPASHHHPHSAFAPLSYLESSSSLTNRGALSGFMQETGQFYDHNTSPQDFSHHGARRPSFVPTANAAAALAELHNSRPESDWEVDREAYHDPTVDQSFPGYFTGSDNNMFPDNPHAGLGDNKDGNLLPSVFPQSSRAGSHQAYARPRPNRPRKSSVTENARKGKHERQKSKDHKRLSGERKTLSVEPGGGGLVHGKRWEDLLDAAASATEEDSRDLTPIPQSPRGSVPPFQGQNHLNQFQSYNTSPLQNTILPHSPEHHTSNFEPPALDAFPTVEGAGVEAPPSGTFHSTYQHEHNSSADSNMSNPYSYGPRPGHQQQSSSGSNFHMGASGLSSSPKDMASSATTAYSRPHGHAHSWSAPHYDAPGRAPVPQQAPASMVQHYCAACHRITPLSSSYACTECICGICRDCVDVLVSMGPDRGARCPRCSVATGRFKPFMLDLR